MTEEQLQNLQARRNEAVARHRALADKPAALISDLRQAECEGAVGVADEVQDELSLFIGPVAAAKHRADILTQLADDAERQLREAENRAAAERAEDMRRWWAYCGRGGPPESPESLANRTRHAEHEAEKWRRLEDGGGAGIVVDGTRMFRPFA